MIRYSNCIKSNNNSRFFNLNFLLNFEVRKKLYLSVERLKLRK